MAIGILINQCIAGMGVILNNTAFYISEEVYLVSTFGIDTYDANGKKLFQANTRALRVRHYQRITGATTRVNLPWVRPTEHVVACLPVHEQLVDFLGAPAYAEVFYGYLRINLLFSTPTVTVPEFIDVMVYDK